MYKTKEYHIAVLMLDIVIKHNSSDTKSLWLLLLHIVINLFSMRGECYYLLDQYQQALQDFDAVTVFDPNYMWNDRYLKDGRKTFVQWHYDNKHFRSVITCLGIMLHGNPSDIESLWYIIIKL